MAARKESGLIKTKRSKHGATRLTPRSKVQTSRTPRAVQLDQKQVFYLAAKRPGLADNEQESCHDVLTKARPRAEGPLPLTSRWRGTSTGERSPVGRTPDHVPNTQGARDGQNGVHPTSKPAPARGPLEPSAEHLCAALPIDENVQTARDLLRKQGVDLCPWITRYACNACPMAGD